MQKSAIEYVFLVMFASMASLILMPYSMAYAHCDTLEGPVVLTAKAALEKGDVTPVLKWVRSEDEEGIRNLFNRTLSVRDKGPEARELADMYFFETLVRIHRAGEGAPYTGLKPATTIDPAVAEADKSLDSGSIDRLVEKLSGAISAGIRSRFERTREARKHSAESIQAGRAFVHSYVEFTHYVEGLHRVASGSAMHHEGTEGKAVEHGEH